MKLNNFEVLKSIGEGGFAQVMLARSKLNLNDKIAKNQVVAIKIISKSHERSIKREIETFEAIKNVKFLSQMIGAFQDRTDAFLVLRYEEGGTLFDLIQRIPNLPLDFTQHLAVEMSIALKFLHEKNIIHGDLKPENVLLDKNLRVRLSDFGLAIKSSEKGYVGAWGTPSYQSPEMLIKDQVWDNRTDFFSLGIIFLMTITGSHPFAKNSRNDSEINTNIRLLKFELPKIQCKDALSFVSKTVCRQEVRLSHHNVLHHPFVKPLVSKLLTMESPDCTLFLIEKGVEMFEDNKNFFKPIQGLDFDGPLWGADSPNPDPNIDMTAHETTTAHNNEHKHVPASSNCNIGMTAEEEATADNNEHEDVPVSSNPNPVNAEITADDEIIIKRLRMKMGDIGKDRLIHKTVSNNFAIRCSKCKKYIKAMKPRNKGLKWQSQPFLRHLLTKRHLKRLQK